MVVRFFAADVNVLENLADDGSIEGLLVAGRVVERAGGEWVGAAFGSDGGDAEVGGDEGEPQPVLDPHAFEVEVVVDLGILLICELIEELAILNRSKFHKLLPCFYIVDLTSPDGHCTLPELEGNTACLVRDLAGRKKLFEVAIWDEEFVGLGITARSWFWISFRVVDLCTFDDRDFFGFLLTNFSRHVYCL